jgi:3-deoxy-D-manno-octulosonic-acid transferase
MFQIYNILSFIALVIYFPLLLFKKGPENKSVFLRERLGLSGYTNADLWFHAVSVGEVKASMRFLQALKKEYPDIKIVLSTITYTGQKIARESFSGAERVMYMPWDTGLCISRAVRNIRPKLFITVETELWPALFRILDKYGTYIVVLNGRLSGRSFKGYKRIRFFMKEVLSRVNYFYMQGRGDVERIIALGAESEKVGFMGNFKYDISLDDHTERALWADTLKGRILVAGSTHKGEDEIVLEAFELIRRNIGDLKLILAPRHPERFGDVEKILKGRKLSFIRRSQIPPDKSRGQVCGEDPDIILLDTVGELSQAYSKADVVFVGGSLMQYGGHNILEPSYWGKPVVFGPFMDNFPMASEFLKDGAAVEVKTAKDMAIKIEDILKNTRKAEQLGQKAKALLEANRGALERALNLVRRTFGTVQRDL